MLLAEDEDCSVASTQLFDPDTSTLGPLSTFRCARYGVTCDVGGETPDEMNIPGAKSTCHANDDSAYVMPVAPYAARLESFKSDPRSILFATIAGPPVPVEVQLTAPPGGGEPIPRLGLSCNVPSGSGFNVAQPGTRLAQATTSFRRHLYASSCDADYGPTLSTVARMIREALGDSCLRDGLALPADCEAADELADGTRTPIPPCSATQSVDCYTLVEDPACSTSHRLRVDVVRASEPAPDTMVSVRCAL